MKNSAQRKTFMDFFTQKENEARETFHEFYGSDGSFIDDDYGFVDDDSYMAAGAPAARRTPTSQPYILNIRNTNSTADVSNVTVLGAYTNLGGTVPSWGNGVNISLNVGIAGLTYQEFLYQSMNKPFQVGTTYMTDTIQTANVTETLSVTQKDLNGNQGTKVLTPIIDPYQQQTDKVSFDYTYNVDGFTSIVISQVYRATASATNLLRIYMFPAENVSTSRALGGQQATKGFKNPNVVRGQKIQLSPAALRGLAGR